MNAGSRGIPSFLSGHVSGVVVKPKVVENSLSSNTMDINIPSKESDHLLGLTKEEAEDPFFHCEKIKSSYLELFYSPILNFEGFKEILLMLEETGSFNDLYVVSGEMLRKKKNKKLTRLLGRDLASHEIERIITEMFSEQAVLASKKPGGRYDDAYDLWQDGTDVKLRYRVIITSYQEPKGGRGLKMVMRKLEAKPHSFDDLNVPDIIRKHCLPKDGLVLVVGETGSGKSTLCSSIFHHVRTMDDYAVTMTYERPIEYILTSIPGRNPIYQHSIGERGDYHTFYEGLSASLRESPEIIFCGEASDKETFEILPKIALSGHLGISTLHASGVTNTFSRIGDEINPTYAMAVVRSFIQFTRMVVYQSLVKSVDGEVTPIQEILVFTPEITKEILSQSNDELYLKIEEMLENHGQTAKSHAKSLLESGKIDQQTYNNVVAA